MLLCIDFSGEKVNILRAENKKEKIKVAESLELDVSDLGDYLQSKSEKVKEIRISGALENTFHKAFIIPHLRSKLFRQALDAEVLKAFGSGYQFKQEDLGEVPGPGNKVNKKIMTAGIKRDTLEEISQIFANSPIKPSIFTTYPIALQALLGKLGVLSEEPLAIVEIAHPKSRIIIFKGKEIRVTRELPLAEKEEDPECSALAKDIYRTLLFYTESYPNQKVAKLTMVGNSTTPEILENLRLKTGLEIIPFSPESLFQGDMSRIYPGCLGLALLDPAHFSFGFTPLSVQQKRKTKKTLTLSSSVSLGVVLICALAVSQFSLDLRNLNVYHGGIKGEIKMKEDRLKELPLEFVSQSIESSQPPWSEILLELAAVVPPGVALKTLTLKKIKNAWQGVVSGVSDGSDEISSLLMVEEVQNNFAQSPLFKGVKLVEKELQGKQVAFKIIYQLDI